MALLPGTLPASSSSSSGASGTAASAGSSSSSTEVSELLSFFHKNLLGSSRESVMVEVSLVLFCFLCTTTVLVCSVEYMLWITAYPARLMAERVP